MLSEELYYIVFKEETLFVYHFIKNICKNDWQ